MDFIRHKTAWLTATVLLCACLQAKSQTVALKTNALYWLATTPNASVEFALSDKVTIDAAAAYNPWTFKDDKKMRFWLAQPEVRYWFCEKFEGHFIGVHLHGAQFFGGFGDTRRDGYLAGGGLTYGYDCLLAPHWNLEFAIGIGYARLWYDESPCIPCRRDVVPKHKDYVGPTKAAITVSYLF